METSDEISFETLVKDRNLLRGIYKYGWQTPSPIQQQGIPAIISGQDCLIQAQSGTGKTGTFSIGLLSRLDYQTSGIQAVIVEPTRELAKQTHQVISELAQHLPVTIILTIGKQAVNTTIEHPEYPIVLVGTIGKTTHVLKQHRSYFRKYRQVVLNPSLLVVDEFDQFLNKQHVSDFHELFKYAVNDSTQVVLISATTNPEHQPIIDKMFRPDIPPKIIKKQNDQLTLEGIKQYHIDCQEAHHKDLVITDLYNSMAIQQSIIFTNTRRQCTQLHQHLKSQDIPADIIHGELTQDQRNQVMQAFRDGDIRILITTDLTARGIDVQRLSVVFNYQLPSDVSQYLHRVGRCGRYGKKGLAISLIAGSKEKELLENIQEHYHTSIPPLPSNVEEIFQSVC